MAAIRLSLLVFIGSLIRCLAQSESAGPTINGVNVDASLKEDPNQRFSLAFTLLNEASPTISREGMYSPPWASPAMTLALFAVEGADDRCGSIRQLRRQWLLDEDRTRIETFPVGSKLAGFVFLNAKFPDLTASLRTCDVLAFWSFQIRPRDGPTVGRFSGWVQI